MTGLKEFNRFTSGLKEDGMLMPVIFVGHGSPMNGILDNEFSRYWKDLAATLPVPRAVLVVSAHWLSKGTRITAMDFPRTIHDFGGFPEELFDVQYPAPGDALLAKETAALVAPGIIEQDHDWGLDHGTWTIVRHMYPEANIPVLQLSIDYTKPPEYHYRLAGELMSLRKKGVLILGSGNMVHNLRMVAWDKLDEPEYGFDWAVEMNAQFKHLISSGDDKALMAFDKLGTNGRLSIPTPEHYLPLIYTLGLRKDSEPVSFFNDKLVGGSLSMTSVRFS